MRTRRLVECPPPEGAALISNDLSTIALFDGLPREALSAIRESGSTVSAYKGQTMIEEGEPSRELYVILKGSVRIQVESITPMVEIGISKLHPGEVVGEMALLGDLPRSATVVACESSQFLKIEASDVLAICASTQEWDRILMRNLAQILAKRLRTMNRRMMNYVRARHY